MRTLVFIISVFFGVGSIQAESPEEPNQDNAIITETETHSVFQGSLYKVWVKLRALSPNVKQDAGRGNIVVTAGIRGSETTESTLKPYWKDDKTADEGFLTQVKSFNSAQSLIDSGKVDEAKVALEKFLKEYPESELLPNALFAQGLTLGASGDVTAGSKALKRFIKDYPKHPLKADAELILKEFNKS